MSNGSSSSMGHLAELCPRRNDVLNTISTLLPCGLQCSLDMPSIIVCGDASSGKSTLLSRITGLPFPISNSLCSPLIFELALRRDETTIVSVEIRPGSCRSEEERQALSAFRPCTRDLDINSMVKEAEEIIRQNTTDRLFCGDVLCIVIAGPTQPHFTLVDSPGLFPPEGNGQFEQDAKCLENTMLAYMKYHKAIILAVLSTGRSFSSQRVIAHARTIDPHGIRTVGIITKPDKLNVGSEGELFYVELARNNLHSHPDWHVLYNRPNATATERDRIEADFLAKGAWRRLDPSRCGIKALRTRVNNILYDEIVDQLPEILKKAEAAIKDHEQQLLRLGAPRNTIDQQRQFLFRVSTAFTGVLKAAVDGWYTGPFFTCSGPSAPSRRLRTVMQNTLSDFAVRMREEGRAQIVQGVELPSTTEPRKVLQANRLEEVEALMQKYRGCELPGTYNPLVEGLICKLESIVMQSVETVINEALHYVTDDYTASGIYRVIIGPYLQELGEALRSKFDELLEPHLLGHPITYNHLLTERVRDAQAARNHFNIEKHLENFFGDLYEGRGKAIIFDMGALLDSLVTERELDMDAYPITMAIDTADAYYNIALEKIIDDVSVLAVERCLIQKLPDLLAADIICHLTDGEVRSIASESNASITERALITEKLTVLKEGLTELSKFKKQPIPSKHPNVSLLATDLRKRV
ncbi:P-loop containing nucleoside triphosphate hydrolase protein [Xylaria scruposa]|nr:P-loop containing nucleoside triphosphate hydrolase protein [Xylaria scruposa]